MAESTVMIDVIDKLSRTHSNISIINKPNPVYSYAATKKELLQLIQIPWYYIYEAGTTTIINGNNFKNYFPEGGGGGGGMTPREVELLIKSKIDSTISTTSTNAVQNSTITNFVNSSIETSTAEFKGTFETRSQLDATVGNKNDYAFLIVKNDDQSVNHYERYKWVDNVSSGSHWVYEYSLNNSSFTSEQWAAINSGVKSTDISELKIDVNNLKNELLGINTLVGEGIANES